MPDRTEDSRRSELEHARTMNQAQLNAAYMGKLVRVDICGLGCCGKVAGIINRVEPNGFGIQAVGDRCSDYVFGYDHILRIHQGGTP